MNFWGFLIGLIFVLFGLGIALNVNVWQYVLPIIFIVIGLSIIFGQSRRHGYQSWKGNPGNSTETHENELNYSFSFSGADIRVVTDDFKGGRVSCFFGGANIDLRNAKIAHNGIITMDVSALFGGVKLMVPSKWKVEGMLSGFLGGFSNKTETPVKPEGTLVLQGSATFGGGEVTN